MTQLSTEPGVQYNGPNIGPASFPPDAACDYAGPNGEKCGHRFDVRDKFNNCGVCNDCDHPVTLESPGCNFHYFVPRRYAGGTFTPDAERELYEKTLRGQA
jgi:hypothetical protein